MFVIECVKCGKKSQITLVTESDCSNLEFDGDVIIETCDYDGQMEISCKVCGNVFKEVW